MAPKCQHLPPLNISKRFYSFYRFGKNLSCQIIFTIYSLQGVVYSVNPKSFQDSDNNGYGDLKGTYITQNHVYKI